VARDYYDVLGVGRNAGPEEIQAAYRRQARANHPDVNRDPAAEDRFKEVNEAYHVLSDPQTRRRYDRFGDDFRRVPEDWEDRVSRSGVRGGGPGVREGGFSDFRDAGYTDFRGGPTGGGAGVDIEDLLGGLFGRGGAPVGGADQGGRTPADRRGGLPGWPTEVTLPGTSGPRTYTVTIPPGVVDGQRIRLGGEGGRGLGGGPAGDPLVVRSSRTSATGWSAETSSSSPVSRGGRPGRDGAGDHPGGEVKVTVPPGPPRSGGCACAARACAIGAVPAATSSPRSP
jgi:curved DNA-binding protein